MLATARGLSARCLQLALAAGAPLLVGAACSDDDPEDPNPVTIQASEFGFAVEDGEPTPGVNTITLRNDGAIEHHLQLFRVDPGKTAEELVAAISDPEAPFPDWIFPAGGVGILSSGPEASVTLDPRAGEYVLLCFVDEPDGVPQFLKGMARGITVEDEEIVAEAPEEDVTITARDYSLEAPESLEPGELTLRFTNASQDIHEVMFARLPDGPDVSDEEIVAAFMEGGPPPFEGLPEFVGGVQAIAPGASQLGTLTIEAGRYVLLCGIPNEEGIPHLALGMIRQIRVE